MAAAARRRLGLVVLFSTILALAAWLALSQLNRLIKAGVEAEGPKITGTAVELERARVSIWSGDGSLRKLRIANPQGFSSPNALDLPDIRIDLDLDSLGDDLIIVRQLKISGAVLSAELSEDGRSNLKTILDHARQAVAQSERGAEHDGASDAGTKRFIIKEFQFLGGSVHVLAPALKLDESVQIPDLRLSNIGEQADGLTLADASLQLLEPIVGAALKQARGEQFDAAVEAFKRKAGEKLREWFD